MIKLILSESYGPEVGVGIEFITSEKELRKKASSDIFNISEEDLKPPKGYLGMHLVALGDYEHFGCFFEGALVKTIDGYKPIETLKVGDLVLTHLNRYKPIVNCFEDIYTGNTVELQVSNLPINIKSTSNHPYFVVRGDDFKPIDRWRAKKENNFEGLREKLFSDIKKVAADDIKPGDYLLVPTGYKDETENLLPDYADPYFMGFYVAEGCLSKEYKDIYSKGEYNKIVFTAAENDRETFKYLYSWAEKNNRNNNKIEKSYTSDVGLRLVFGFKEFAELIDNCFGHLAKTKRIGKEIFELNETQKLQFLAGYFDGDGCIENTETRSRYIGTLRASTISYDLALDMQRLMASVGIPSSVFKCYNYERNRKTEGFGKGRGDLPIFSISVGATHSNKILNHCKRLAIHSKEIKTGGPSAHSFFDYLFVPVRKVIKESVEDVYKFNIEVEDDHSYVVQGVAVGNSNRNADAFRKTACEKYHHTFVENGTAFRNHVNKDPLKSIGIVKASAYNEPMGRIELFTHWSERDAAPELEEFEKKGEAPFSMACVLDPSYPVLTLEGYKNISDITTDDRVLTKEGKWCKVKALNRRRYTGDVVSLSFETLPTLDVTADHLLLENGVFVYANTIKTGSKLDGFKTFTANKPCSYEVTAISGYKVRDQVTYNIEVETDADDGTYLLAGIISHNCYVPGDVCYTEGTPVFTNLGSKNIENIELNDLVLTHRGNYRRVNDLHKNLFTGNLITVKPRGLKEFSLTDNHPIFRVKKELLHANSGRRYNIDSENNIKYYGHNIGEVENHIDLVEAKQLNLGDYLLTPVVETDKEIKSSDRDIAFAYVAGRYAGDGSLTKERRGRKRRGEPYITGLTFACEEELETVMFLVEMLKKVTDVNVLFRHNSRNKLGHDVRVTDRKLAHQIHDLIGAKFNKKKAPLAWKTNEERLAFIAGCIDSDGHFDPKSQQLRVCMCNKNLIYALWKICLDAGVYAAIHKEFITGGFKKYKTECYIHVLSIGKTFAEKFLPYSAKLKNVKLFKNFNAFNVVRWGNYVLRSIESIKYQEVEDKTVFNLTVDGEETYVAGGVSTHNCSICGTFRKNAADPNQCDHVRYNLGKLEKDGKQIFTFNPDPNWFDISILKNKPADRIAWSLSAMKAASVDNDFVDSITLAKKANIFIPDSIAITTQQAKRRHRYLTKIANNLKKHISWSRGESIPTSLNDLYNLELSKSAASIGNDVIRVLSKHSPGIVIPKLAEVGVIMSPQDFFKYVKAETQYPQEVIKKAIACIPDVIITTVAEKRSSEICNDDCFEFQTVTGMTPISTIKKASYLVGPETIRDRVLENSIKGFDKKAKIVFNSSTNEEQGLAEKYAAYLLSTIDRVKNTDEDNICAIAATQILFN